MSKYSKNIPQNEELLREHFGQTYEFIPERGEVLDFGCSTGYYGQLLMSLKQCMVDGVEVSVADAKEAKTKLRKVFVVNVEQAGWPKDLLARRYDVVFFGDVLEHLIAPAAVLATAKTLLKPKGVVIISTPNIAHASIRLELLSGNFDYEPLGILDETHTKYFTVSSLQRLLKSSGLSPVKVDYSTNSLPPDVVQIWLDKLGLTASKKFYNLLSRPDAQAYQFKIVAKASPSASKATLALPTKPLEVRDRYIGELGKAWADNKLLTKQFKEISEINKRLEKDVERLEYLNRPIHRKVLHAVKHRLSLKRPNNPNKPG